MTWTFALDILIVALLIPTIAYAVILNGKLTSLRKNRDDLAKVIQSFNEATLRAEAGIPKLRQAAEETGQSLQEEVVKAQALRDDLAYMVERGEGLADKLEESVRAARGEVKPSPRSAAPAAPKKTIKKAAAPLRATKNDQAGGDLGVDDERSEAERELLKALQSVR